MKTPTTTRILGTTALLLVLVGSPAQADLFSPSDAVRNHAVAASPRAQEVFPELSRTRGGAASDASRTLATRPSPASAWAASPRVLEEFVALSRVERQGSKVRGRASEPLVWGVPLAANPRAIEENPALARQPGGIKATGGPAFQLAPLK